MNALRRHLAVPFLLLTAALVLRLGVPFGWMPVTDGQGNITVAVCSDGGPVFVEIETGKAGPGNETPRDPCPFGLAGAAGLDLPELPSLPAPPLARQAPQPPELALLPLRAPVALPPPARGPPVFA